MTDYDSLVGVVDMAELLACMNEREALAKRWRHERNTPARWQIIRDAYKERLPHILRRSALNRTIDPYFLDWDFTPIERLAWQDIRSSLMPFYPQFPVGRCFIDFADPYRKIGVELDGRAFHEETRDRARDLSLWEHGWRIFRIPGYKSLPSGCAPFVDDWKYRLEYEPGAFLSELKEWAERWSEGIFWALNFFYVTPVAEQDVRFFHAAVHSLEVNRLVPFCLDLEIDQLEETI